jgi:hypothetical protein
MLEKLGGVLRGGDVETSETDTTTVAETSAGGTQADESATTEQTSAKEPDYKALLEASSAENAKLLNDAKSRAGRTEAREKQERQIGRLTSQVTDLTGRVDVFLKRESENDSDLADSLAKDSATRSFNQRTVAFADDAVDTLGLMERALIVPGENGSGDVQLLDLRTSPELQEVRDAWDAEIEKTAPEAAVIKGLLADVRLQAQLKERALSNQRIGEIQTQATKTTEQAEEEVDQAYNMNIGPGGSVASSSFTTIRDAYNEDPYDDKVRAAYYKARKQMGL